MNKLILLLTATFFVSTIFAQNVGIGTAGPSEKLDVSGNIKASGEVYWGNSNTRTQTRNDAGDWGSGVRSGFYETSAPINFPTGASSWWHLLDVRHNNPANNYAMQIAGSFYDQDLWYRKTQNDGTRAWSKVISSNDLSGTDNYLAKFTGANSIGNSQLFDNGTNVGIGTTSPDFKLHVEGQVLFDIYGQGSGAGIRFREGFTYNLGMFAYDDGDGTPDALDIAAYDGLYFNTGSNSRNPRMTITSGGDVGIGTENPNSKFEVDGSFYVDVGNAGNMTLFEHTGAGSPVPFNIRKTGYSGSSQSYGVLQLDMNHNVVGGGSNLYFRLKDDGGSWVEYGGIGASIQSNSGGGQGKLHFYTANRSEQMTILNNGNVGIGTTSPVQRLHVSGTGRFTSLSSGGNGAFVRTNTSGDLAITNFTGDNKQVLRGNGTFGDVPLEQYSLPNTGGSNQWVKLGTLTIPQNGRSAYFKIVSNSGYNANINQNFEVYIRFKTSNGGSTDANGFAADASYYMEGRYAQFATDGRIKFKANAAGTSASSYELYMYFGNYTGNNSFYTVETTGGNWTHSGAAGQSDPGAASSTVLIPTQEFNIRANSLVVDASGNVGIGMNNPSYKLHVNGRLKTNGINETSDIRFKKDIKPLEGSLDKVMQLQGVSYYWKVEDFPDRKFEKGKDIGVIAQEVEKIFPEVVDTDNEGYKSVQYSHLVPVLIEAIKELKAENNALQEKSDKYEALLNQLDVEKLLQDYSSQAITAEK